MAPRWRVTIEVAALIALAGIAAFLWTAPRRAERALTSASLPELIAQSKRQKDNSRVFYHMGLRLMQLGHLGPATAALERAATLEPDNEDIWLAWTSAAASFSGDQQAFGILGTFVKNHPDSVRGHLALALLYQQRNAEKSAYEEAQTVAKIDPKNVAAWRLMGVMGLRLNKKAEAEQALRQAVALEPNAWQNHLLLGQALTAQHRYPEAQGAFQRAVETAPDEPRTLAALGSMQLLNAASDADAVKAAETLQKAVAKDETNLSARLSLAETYLRLKRAPEAETQLLAAERLDPTSPETAIRLKQVALLRGDKAAAEKFGKIHQQRIATNMERLRLQSEVWQKPKDAESRLKMARFYRDHREWGAAADAYERLLSLDIPFAERTAASAERDKLRLDRPEAFAPAPLSLPMPEAATESARASSTSDLLKDAAGMVAKQRYDVAEKTYLSILRREPKNADAYEGLGRAYQGKEDDDNAFRAFSFALRLDPKRHTSLYELAHVYFAGGFPDQSAKYMEDAVKLAPSNAEYWHALGLSTVSVLTISGDKRAAFAFGKAAELDPKNIAYWRDLANAESKLKEDARAEAHYRKALALDPSDPTSQELLGFHLADRGLTAAARRESEELLRKSLAKNPDNANVLLGLGLLEEQRGDYKIARDHLEKAVALLPTMTSAWYRLERVHRRLGNPVRADECAKKFQSLTDFARQFARAEGLAKINRKDPKLRLELARIYVEGRFYAKAINQYQMCLFLEPKNVEAKQELEALSAELKRVGQMPKMKMFQGMMIAAIGRNEQQERKVLRDDLR